MYYYTFEQNHHYCYSCKFVDKKYLPGTIEEFIEELQHQCIKNIKIDLIQAFFEDMIEYFEKLDRDFEKDGYIYLYNVEEEIEDFCNANDYYFTETGAII
jgi:hypothetical protein